MAFYSVYDVLAEGYCRQIAGVLRKSPSMWTQGAYARDEKGAYTNPLGFTAQAWCLLGFLEVVCVGRAELRSHMSCTLERLLGRPVPSWNDDPARSVGDVIALLERAAQTFASRRAMPLIQPVPDWNAFAKPAVCVAVEEHRDALAA